MIVSVKVEPMFSGKKVLYRPIVLVESPRDYPTSDIFSDSTDYPTRPGWALRRGKTNYIVGPVSKTPEVCFSWGEKQIEKISAALEHWRLQEHIEPKVFVL